MDASVLKELAHKVEEALPNSPEAIEVMHLKLKLEVAASRLYLTLGWMLHDGRVILEPSDFGFKVRRGLANAPALDVEDTMDALLPRRE